MTARDVFKRQMSFRIMLGKLIHEYESSTGGKIEDPIHFDRLLNGDGEQIVITPQPIFDNSNVVVDRYGDANNYDNNYNSFEGE